MFAVYSYIAEYMGLRSGMNGQLISVLYAREFGQSDVLVNNVAVMPLSCLRVIRGIGRHGSCQY